MHDFVNEYFADFVLDQNFCQVNRFLLCVWIGSIYGRAIVAMPPNNPAKDGSMQTANRSEPLPISTSSGYAPQNKTPRKRHSANDENADNTRSNKRFRRNGFSKSFLKSRHVMYISPYYHLRNTTSDTQAYMKLVSFSDKTPLFAWGLPDPILNHYNKKGITHLFDWQVQCLERTGVLHKARNLVYSAPTSAGKSMVADMLMYKTLFERKKKAIIILPFVSISVEKVQSLKQTLSYTGITMDSFAGNVNPRGGLARVDVAVCTIEKANNMINK